MGLESLFAFTLLGGIAAGAYVFEACFTRKRSGERPWLLPLVVVALFAIGMIAASTHVQSIPRAMGSLTSGTVNFGSGMVREVAVSGVFFVLALIDMIVTFVKKDSPFALRVVTAVFAVLCMILMATAYIDVYGNPVWTDAPATVLSFLAGDLAAGLGLCVALGAADLGEKPVANTMIAMDVVLAVGMALEIASFSAAGASPVMQIVGLVVAPVASAVLTLCAAKFANKQTLAIIVCAALIIGVAVARYAFYATCAL